jgi:hypothetical protein
LPVDLDDEASALDLIDRIRGLRLNGAENFEIWLQQRADAEYSASLLVAHAGLTDDTRTELNREATLLRRQANPPTSGARVWTRSDERISSASEVDDPKLAEAKAYDLIDRMRSLRLNGPAVGVDLHRERSYLLSQGHLLLTTASLRPATRTSLSAEVDQLEQLSSDDSPPTPVATPTAPHSTPPPKATSPTVPAPAAEATVENEPPSTTDDARDETHDESTTPQTSSRPGFWRRLGQRLFGTSVSDEN